MFISELFNKHSSIKIMFKIRDLKDNSNVLSVV